MQTRPPPSKDARRAPLQIGRYVLHGEIASGGMASVHYGRLVGTAGFAKTVAIKRLHRELARADSFRKMILEEGRLAARVRHPNVVPPLDILAEGGELLLVMEYVHGESLSRLVRAARGLGERVPLPVGAAILSNVLHGLHAAHEACDEAGMPLDIVHRDVSPQNIIVGVDGIARVIDFGIAKAVTSEERTTAGTIKGKVPYLAPEQLEGDPATKRTDLYATAVVFWEVLAGRRLFEGQDDGEILRQIMTMEIKPPSAFNPLVPGTIDDVVLRAIARDPKERFATAREMALALEGAVHLATASVVGAWTERLAADTLAERAAKIREVEASLPPPEEAASPAGTVRMSAAQAVLPPPLPSGAARASRPPGPPPSATRPPPSATRPPVPVPVPVADAAHPFAATALAISAHPSIPAPPEPGAPRLSIPSSQRAPVPGQPAPTLQPSTPRDPPPSIRASMPPMRPPSASRPMIMEPRTVIYEPPPMPEAEFIEGVRALSRDAPAPFAPMDPLVPAAPSSGALPPSAPSPTFRAPLTALEIERRKQLLQPEAANPQGSAFKRFLRYLIAFLVLALIVAWMFAPAIARAWLVTGAASRGIVMTIDRVDVSRRAIRLLDVHVQSPDLPGVAMRGGNVVIGLRWLTPDRITVDDAELTIDGSYSAVSARLDQYRAKQGAQLLAPFAGMTRIEITSGRVDWRGPIGAGTSALVENITFDINKNPVRAFGGDYQLRAPLFTMKLGGAPAGPWRLEVDRQGILVRSVLWFDPSANYGASITRTAADDGSVSLKLAIPPTLLSDLHIPASVLGAYGSDRTRVEARGELSIDVVAQTTTRAGDASAPSPAHSSAGDRRAGDGGTGDAGAAGAAGGPTTTTTTSRTVSGQAVFSASNLGVFATGAPVDVSFALPLSGDASRPLPTAGLLTFAAANPGGGPVAATATASMSGTVDVSGRAVIVELTGTSGAIPCAKVAGSAESGTTAVRASIAMALDDLAGAKVAFQPTSPCTPKLR